MSTVQALAQLGMDLDRDSSTARGSIAPGAARAAAVADARKDYFIERDGERYAGTHLIVDLFEAQRLDDLAHAEATLRRCVQAAGATLLDLQLHHFTPNHGISGVAVLAESHISIHTWPEYGYAALDIFMCGAARPQAAVEELRRAYRPGRIAVEEHLRGRIR